MKWIGTRISFHEKDEVTSFVIYPEKKNWLVSLVGAWAAMWLVIGITVFWAYFAFILNSTEKIILIVFLAFWIFYAIQIGKVLFWMTAGREMIRLSPEKMTYKKSYGKYGKAHTLFYENISKISLNTPRTNSLQAAWENAPWTIGGERIDFQHMGKTYRFGRKLDEKDAKMLFQIFTKRIEHWQKKSKLKY